MPNGHGGIPRWGSPVAFSLYFIGLVYMRVATSFGPWTVWTALVVAAVVGWRIAWHHHMFDAMDYEGAYTAEDVIARARKRYFIAAPIYISIAVGAAAALLYYVEAF